MTVSTPQSRQQAAAEKLWARRGTDGIRVVLVEPSRSQGRPLEADLRALGVHVTAFKEPMRAMVALGKEGTDVVIASANLGKGKLRLTCATVRDEFELPVLIAYRPTEVDLISNAVLAGARPVLRLPYDTVEVIHALAGIEPHARPRLVPFEVGDLKLAPEAHSTSIAGVPVDLSPTEFSLLIQLASNPDLAVPRHVLITRIWPLATDPDSALAATMKRLRRKLADAGVAQAVHTVRSVGYRLESRGCTVSVDDSGTGSSGSWPTDLPEEEPPLGIG